MSSHPIAPSDQAVRDRFAGEVDRNASLICPAGSGKTHALIDRVAAIGRRPNAEALLANLIVCTFTKRSADELRQRARDRFRKERFSASIVAALDQAKFGTIHSVAVEFLRQFGYLIGVPSSFEVASDKAGALFLSFLKDAEQNSAIYANSAFRRALKHVRIQDIHLLCQTWDSSRIIPEVGAAVPAFDFSEIYAYTPKIKRKDSILNIALFQTRVRAFEAALNTDDGGFVELPEATKGGEEFVEICTRVLEPVAAWLRLAAVAIAGSSVDAFRNYRVSRGILTYDDQVDLAAELFRHPEAATRLRELGYSVLLDEAQDTDPAQFDVLIEVARPVSATGSWRDAGALPPAPGRYSMAGDLQQSIYSSRADLATYIKAHEFITTAPGGAALVFDVTFRCDQAIIDFANKVFPSIFGRKDGQVEYVALQPRPDVGPGQVLRVPVSGLPTDDSDPETHEAEEIANFLSTNGPKTLGTSTWGGVAILCPRKSWFGAFRSALLRRGIPSVYLSQSDRNLDSPAYLWFTALSTVMTDPRNGFEITGVLRDIFGVSDRDLATFTGGKGRRLQIETAGAGEGSVADALREMHSLYSEISRLPLRDAIGMLDSRILRGRLLALDAADFPGMGQAADKIVALSSRLESEGKGLREFSRQLRDGIKDAPDLARERSDAVTILTNLKSKGLQWDVVVVPYLYRAITLLALPYPRLVGERHSVAVAAFGPCDAAAYEVKLAKLRQQELERTLYVTLTRAKRSLILVDDRAIYPSAPEASYSMAGALRVGGSNLAAWEALPGISAIRGADSATDRIEVAAVEVDSAKLAELSAIFPRKITPHSLANGTSAEEPEARIDQPLLSRNASVSVAYGVWWHETMRTMPWGSGRAAWTGHFTSELPGCSDPARGEAEWAMFFVSELATTLERPDIIIHPETPFMVPLEGGNVLEGVIDLALRSDSGRWLVVDWKTGGLDLTPEEIMDEYSGQLDAYKLAVEASTGEKVSVAVYPTHSGALVRREA